MSTCLLAWSSDLAVGYKEDAQTSRVLVELSVGTSKHPKFTLKDGTYVMMVYLDCQQYRSATEILQLMHSSAIGGHLGFQVTYHKT